MINLPSELPVNMIAGIDRLVLLVAYVYRCDDTPHEAGYGDRDPLPGRWLGMIKLRLSNKPIRSVSILRCSGMQLQRMYLKVVLKADCCTRLTQK